MENKNQSEKQNSKNESNNSKKLSNENIEEEEIDLDEKIKVKPSTNGEHYKSNNKNFSKSNQTKNENSNSQNNSNNTNKLKNKNSSKSLDDPNNESENFSEKEQDKKKSKSEHKFLVRHHWWIDALLFIGGTILLGGLATLLGGKMFNFENYDMPPATAPKIVFPIAWSIIYIAIGISTFLMWRDKDINSKDRKINLILYFVHMFFNILWPLWFFRLDLPIFAAIWLVFVVASAAVVMYRYFVCNLPAGIIFTIYYIWLLYALYLNLGLVLINF